MSPKALSSKSEVDRLICISHFPRVLAQITTLENELDDSRALLDIEAAKIPNITHPAVPDDEIHVLRMQSSIENLAYSKGAFDPLDHVTLGEKHDLFDFEAGV